MKQQNNLYKNHVAAIFNEVSFRYIASILLECLITTALSGNLIAMTSDHIRRILETLHWLPATRRIQYTISTICFSYISGTAPQYQSDLLQPYTHTPSTASRHLPPNSARFSYANEGALFISAQLSSDAVSALRKVRVLIRLWKQHSAQART